MGHAASLGTDHDGDQPGASTVSFCLARMCDACMIDACARDVITYNRVKGRSGILLQSDVFFRVESVSCDALKLGRHTVHARALNSTAAFGSEGGEIVRAPPLVSKRGTPRSLSKVPQRPGNRSIARWSCAFSSCVPR